MAQIAMIYSNIAFLLQIIQEMKKLVLFCWICWRLEERITWFLKIASMRSNIVSILLKKNDIIVIAGKGAESTQEIDGVFYPYNDEDFVKELFHKEE